MLLVTDVGNSNITLGVFDGEKLEATFRLTTKIPRTSDEYGICLLYTTPSPRDMRSTRMPSSA